MNEKERSEIIRMAREAGGTAYVNRHYPGETAMAFGPQALERFAQLIEANAAAAEREALASEAEKNGNTILAMQIRARGQQ